MPIQYKQYGDVTAPLMLFLHGGGVSGWMWDKQIQHFRHYHCIVPDLPGHGVSYEDNSFSIQQTATELIELVEKLAHDKPIIAIGFSLGAQVLVQMLSDKPDLIQHAMINSALVQPMPFAAACIAPLMICSYPLIKLRSFAKLQARTLYIGPDYFERYYQESLLIKRELLIEVLKQNMSFEMPAQFAEARANILITVGQQEKGMMKSSAEKLHRSNPNSKLIVFNDVGHGLSMQNPEHFNKTLENWINNSL